MDVLFLSCSRVLKPDLSHSFAQASDRGYSLEILTVGIAIYLKVCLQHLKLLFGESCTNSLSFVLVITIAFASICNEFLLRNMNIHRCFLTCHRSTLFHHRHSPYSEICIKPYRPTKQIVHLSRAAFRTGHRRNKRDETPTLSLVSPSPMRQSRDNILNILLRNSWKKCSSGHENYEKQF